MSDFFPKATPESVGISSLDVQGLLDDFEKFGLYMHSLLIIKNGKLVTEGYYAPFTRDKKHRMYSMTKSFVSGAIGLLVDEGRISLSDRFCKYFPEYPPETLHPFIREATVRDLLMMSSPHSTTYSLKGDGRNAKHWVESYFTTPPIKPAGTVFLYDTGATYMLNVIVERLVGKPFLEYMKDKMLRELGFSEDAHCLNSPDGYSWGGSTLLCTPLDLAKFGFVLLRGGNVGGKQYLSKEYVKEATTVQNLTNLFGYVCPYRSVGYGYQIWCMPENTFCFVGMGAQYVVCQPEKDLMVVVTADNQGVPAAESEIMDSILDRIVRKAEMNPLPENPEALDALSKRLETLSIPLPKGEMTSPIVEKINGVKYLLEDNELGFKYVRFTFSGDEGVLHYENARGEKEIPFAFGRYKPLIFPETHYSGDTIGTPKGSGYEAVAAAAWITESQLMLRVNIVDDYLGNWGVTFGFKGDQIGLSAIKVAEAFLDDYIGRAGGFAEK